MKKIIILSLLVLTISFLLVSCGGDSAIAGEAVRAGDFCVHNDIAYTGFLSECADDTVIDRFTCRNGVETQASSFDCADSGKICENGLCVGADVTCTDSDGGVDVYTAGTVNSVEGEYSDFCQPSYGDLSFVNEYSCQTNGSYAFDQIDCGVGEFCLNGACIEEEGGEAELTCVDSDGGANENESGIVTQYIDGVINGTWVDTCSQYTNGVKEINCLDDGNVEGYPSTIPCAEGRICEDGACVESGFGCYNVTAINASGTFDCSLNLSNYYWSAIECGISQEDSYYCCDPQAPTNSNSACSY